MATIVDVAREAGVSPSTVSHVINSTRFVSDEVKQRVYAAMESLDYHPNALARSLRTKETRIIGVVVSDVTNPFFTSIVRAIEDHVIKYGYNIMLCDTDEQPEREETYIRLLMSKRVDGLIVAPSSGSVELLSSVDESGVPIVLLDRQAQGLDVDAVLCDNIEGAYQAVLHLLRLGHRRIGIITGRLEVSTGADRLTGYCKALREFDIPIDDSLIKSANFRRDHAYNRAFELLDTKNAPTAIFSCNNVMTAGALQAIRETGLNVPDDVSLVGFDDCEWAALMDPPLTVVQQPLQEIGIKAADLLLRRIKKTPVETSRPVVLKPRLVVRGSCRSVLV